MKILSYEKYINENNYEGFYIIGWGLGGGFGGIQNFEVIKSHSKDNAEKEAYQNAVELYSTYDGMHGLRSVDDIMEEDGVDSDEAETIYNDEMESWLEYSAEPYTKERENKVKDYHYTNRWSDELDSINESKIYDWKILPEEAIKELESYVDVNDSSNKIEVYPDPQVEGTYALKIYRHSDDLTFNLLWYKGGYDEVDFDVFPPKSDGLKFWI